MPHALLLYLHRLRTNTDNMLVGPLIIPPGDLLESGAKNLDELLEHISPLHFCSLHVTNVNLLSL